LYALTQDFWPLDEGDGISIFEDLSSANRDKCSIVLETVEIKMIYVGAIPLIIGICRTPDDERGITHVFSQDMSDEGRLASPEIPIQKNTISSLERDIDIVKGFFIVDEVFVCHFLHNESRYDMLDTVSIILSYARAQPNSNHPKTKSSHLEGQYRTPRIHSPRIGRDFCLSDRTRTAAHNTHGYYPRYRGSHRIWIHPERYHRGWYPRIIYASSVY
jgi:hypothetical protein